MYHLRDERPARDPGNSQLTSRTNTIGSRPSGSSGEFTGDAAAAGIRNSKKWLFSAVLVMLISDPYF